MTTLVFIYCCVHDIDKRGDRAASRKKNNGDCYLTKISPEVIIAVEIGNFLLLHCSAKRLHIFTILLFLLLLASKFCRITFTKHSHPPFFLYVLTFIYKRQVYLELVQAR